MKNRFLSITVSAALALAFVACGNNGSTNNHNTNLNDANNGCPNHCRDANSSRTNNGSSNDNCFNHCRTSTTVPSWGQNSLLLRSLPL